jgi:UDP-N-acetylglucosamine acyltransferase
MPIHATAIVDRAAEIDSSVAVGPYAIIEAGVQIGAGVQVWAHAFIARGTALGRDVQVHPFAVVGHLPQDLKYKDAPSYTSVGDGTIVREHASIHRGTAPETTTRVGARCFIMATGHIAHNCEVGDDVVIANSAVLGGHVTVGSRAFISGNASIHQFVRVGELAMVGGNCRLVNDLAPFMALVPEGIMGPNVVGLRRAGYSDAERSEIRRCFLLLRRGDCLFPEAVQRIEALVQTVPGRRFVEFLQAPSKRGILSFRSRRSPAATSEAET